MNSAFFIYGLRPSVGQSRSFLYCIIIDARYFRIGRYLRGFVVSAKDKRREELPAFLGLTGWQCQSRVTMAPANLFIDSEKFNSPGTTIHVVASAFSPWRAHLAEERDLWGP